MRPSAAFRSHIKADKFFPPQVNGPQFLYRQRIIESLLRHNDARKATIVVEAQPGLGKSTAIKQFLDRSKTVSAWYRVGCEDSDPGFFLQAIPACINTLLPDCPSAATARVLGSGDFSLLDLPRRLDLLLRDLEECLSSDLYLVFDDLHHLLPHPASLFILNYLLESAPRRLHFILISREPLTGLDSLNRQKNVLRLDNRGLVMDAHEITDFFDQTLHLAVPLDIINKISLITDGWIMGVQLLGLQLAQHRDNSDLTRLIHREPSDQGNILPYFREEIFSLLDETVHQPLLLLSLLDEIPVTLAAELTGNQDIGGILRDLVRRNIFIRHLDPDQTQFGLHYFFKRFLQEKAKAELSPDTMTSVYRQAGHFHLQQGHWILGLRYLLQAKEYRQIDTLLQDNGMIFLATNQMATLHAILSQIPDSTLQNMGWASLFLALAHMDSSPMQALPLLDQALAVFSLQEDEAGELLSLTHSISIRIITTGHYRDGESLLDRAVQLFSLVADTLDVSTTILVARSLAMGYCIFLADIDEATRYASLALTLARKEGLINFEAALLMVMGYIRIFAGHMNLTKIYLEQAASLVHHGEVGIFNRLAIRMMLFNFLFHDGDFFNYFEQKHQFIDTFGLELVSQSIAGPFCYIWEMDIALNQGDYSTALTLADQAQAQHPPFSPHLMSQVLQLKSVALAMQGRCAQAVTTAEESLQLRDLAGGRYFITLNKLVAGIVYCHCGHQNQGFALLDEGIGNARRMPTEYLEACGLLHRADAFLVSGQQAPALRDIADGMRLMHRNAYRHFWAWTPAAMTRILTAAVHHQLEHRYARSLAAGRLHLALLDHNGSIPLLEIRTLGGIALQAQGKTLLEAEALTPLQRELLALLIAAPGLKIPQETICLHFWPDSSQNAVKIKFDTLVSRLRKALADVLPKNTAQLYLNREKGMLWLAHCRIDAHHFLQGVKQGRIHYRLQEFWQAGNVFTAAEPLWQGEFAPGVPGEDSIRVFRDQLVNALSEMAVSWSDILVSSRCLPRAIRVVEKALQYDQLNDRLHTVLYRLEGQQSALRARGVLKRYETLLRQEGYSPDEISSLITALSSPQGNTPQLKQP